MGRLAEVVVLAVGVALVLLALAGCPGRVTSRPQTSVDEALNDARWCVVGDVQGHRFVACTDREDVCDRYLRQARKRGRWVGLRSLSSCEPQGWTGEGRE